MNFPKRGSAPIASLLVLLLLIGGLLFTVSMQQQQTNLFSKASSTSSKNAVTCDGLTLNPQNGYNPLTTIATITAHSYGGEKILSYKFDFGDGTPAIVQVGNVLSHQYPNAGSYTVKGYVTGKLTGEVGGSGNCQMVVIVTEGTITIDKTSVVETLDKANAVNGLVFGNGFNITSLGATGWQIHYNEGTVGYGFYDSSGGITSGASVSIRSYINPNLANGTYTGNYTVQYYKNGVWTSSNYIVNYTINLVN